MHEGGGGGPRALTVRQQRRGAPTCDAVFNLPLHLEGVHIDGPVPDEACARDPPVWLAEAVLVVVVSGEDTAVSTLVCLGFSSNPAFLFFIFLRSLNFTGLIFCYTSSDASN